ncbi:MAG TPA: NfeD family protein [Candidatus Fusicatenibacter intestinigallinarum]|uniref:NfeD family protein n=1 Tax=Candidatus Fusicatenibacter intestinigallinarum TaxID=2838598 RepID=A0A9D2NB81_9FIRM|nr:NfeD family protein [Candidatus Fusicatenibacter intestinigallinarum]
MYAIIWLAALVILLLAEALTLGLTTIWFAGGALIALIAALVGANVWVQLGIFLAVSLLLLIFTRPAALRYMNKSTLKTNVDSLTGEVGVVSERIDNLEATGKVKLNDVLWTARSEDGTVIEEGAVVEISRVEGVKLIVKMKEEEK